MNFKKWLFPKVVKTLTVVVIGVTLLVASVMSVSAVGGASESVKDNANGVIKIECVYGDDNILVRSCAGFIINHSHAITSKEIVGRSAESILRDQYGSNFQFDKSKLRYRTKISGVYINATDVLNATDTDNSFAVLSLSKAIDLEKSNYRRVELGSSKDLSITETVYTIGYSTTDRDSTVINEGKISKITDKYIEYTMNNPTEGFVGSPVIDEAGGVVALTVSLTNDGYRAIPIDDIKEVLNTFTIDYANSTGVLPKPVEVTSIPVVESSIVSVPSSEPEPIREHSVIIDDDPVVPPESEEDNTIMIIIIAAIGAVVLVLIIVIVLIATRKKPTAIPNSGNFRPVSGGVPQSGGYVPPVSPTQQTNYPVNPVSSVSTSGETTVLNAGSDETTLLGSSATVGVPSGVLVNLKTNEKIVINKPEFSIGRERNKVDYPIDGESSVGRLHAKIRVRAGKCYVVDMNSKNGTFINGSKLNPNEEVLIQNGDRLKIAVVEYEFRN